MPNTNLDPTSGRGWRRLCFIGALLWIPLTMLLSALNVFGLYGSDDNALLFWFSGTIILIVLGFTGPWIVRGFERKAKDKE